MIPPDFFLVVFTALAILFAWPLAVLCGVMITAAMADAVITLVRTLTRQ